jgi:hypothetical protein
VRERERERERETERERERERQRERERERERVGAERVLGRGGNKASAYGELLSLSRCIT